MLAGRNSLAWMIPAFAFLAIGLMLSSGLVGAGVVLNDGTSAPAASTSTNPLSSISSSQLASSNAALSEVEQKAATLTSLSKSMEQAASDGQGIASSLKTANLGTLEQLHSELLSITPQQFAEVVSGGTTTTAPSAAIARDYYTLLNDTSAAGFSAVTGLSADSFTLPGLNVFWSTVVTNLYVVESGCIIGSVVPAVGTAVGCIVGLSAAVGISLYQLYTAGSAALSNLAALESFWVTAMYNEFSLINADYLTILTLLNSTVYALETEAAAAAKGQLGNSTFNTGLDLAQSFVYSNVLTLQNAMLSEASETWSQFVTTVGSYFSHSSQYGCGQSDNPANDYFTVIPQVGGFIPFGCANSGTIPGNGSADFWIETGGALSDDVEVYIPEHTTFSIQASGDEGCTLQLVDAQPMVFSNDTYATSVPTVVSSGTAVTVYEDWTHEGGLFWFNASASGVGVECDLYGAEIFATAPGTDTTPENTFGPSLFVCAGTGGDTQNYAPSCNPLNQTVHGGYEGLGTASLEGYVDVTAYDGHTNEPNTETLNIGGGAFASMSNEVTNLLFLAGNVGYVYWHFLRLLGYTSISQIPANCNIPYPSQALPSAYEKTIDQMNVNQLTQLYVAWMNGESVYYDTPPGVSTFCAGTPAWNLGGSPLGNLYVNATGYVYVPSTSANTYPNETFANISGTYSSVAKQAVLTHAQNVALSTWAVNGSLSAPVFHDDIQETNVTGSCWTPLIANATPQSRTNTCNAEQEVNASLNATQLVMWPLTEIPYLNITVGTVYEIPADVPSQIYATEPGILLTNAYGNGTIKGGIAHGAAPGYAIFLSSCQVNGTPEQTCNMALSTINGFIGNLTNCLKWGYINGCKPPKTGGNSTSFNACTIWFVSYFTAALQSIPLIGSAIGCAIGYVVLIVLVFLVAYLAVVVVRRGLRRSPSSMNG